MTIKKDLKVYSVNHLYLIFGKVNEYFEKINDNKYLARVPTSASKEKIKKSEELWIRIRDLIRSITKSLDDCDEKYMKIQFDSDDNLILNETIEIPIMTIVIKAIFYENKKYYPEVFSDECLYEI